MRYVVYHGQWVVCAHFHGNNPLPNPYTLSLFPKQQRRMNPVEELQQGMSLTVQNLPALEQVADATETHTIM